MSDDPRAKAVEGILRDGFVDDDRYLYVGSMEGDMLDAFARDVALTVIAALDALPTEDARGPTGNTEAASPFPTPRYHLLDIWLALGGTGDVFAEWIGDPRRTPSDAWAQLMCAISGDVAILERDTNPPAGAVIALASDRRELEGIVYDFAAVDVCIDDDIEPTWERACEYAKAHPKETARP